MTDVMQKELGMLNEQIEEEGHCECKHTKRKVVLIFTQELIKHYNNKFFGLFSNIIK